MPKITKPAPTKGAQNNVRGKTSSKTTKVGGVDVPNQWAKAGKTLASQLKDSGLSKNQINRRMKQWLTNMNASIHQKAATIKAAGLAATENITPNVAPATASLAINNANDLVSAGTSRNDSNNTTDKSSDSNDEYGDKRS